MNRDFGELSELVKVVGMLMSAAFAITLAWRGRTRWEPSEQDLPEAPKRVAGLLTAIVLPVLWVVLASPSHAGLLASLAFALVLASILFLIFYSLHVGVLTYELPRDEGQPSPKRVVGGYWLTTEARRKTLLKTSPLSPAEYLTMVGEPDKVWPRLSRALARVSFLLGYVGFVVCGSAGLTCAAILFIVGTSAEGEGDPGNQPTAEVRIREVVGVVGTSEEGEGESGNQTAAEEPIRERDRVVGTSEEGEGESGSQTAAEEPIRERDQEVEGDPDNQRKMEELFRELDRVEGELRNATSRADVIRVLSRGLNQVEEAATSISDPGANYRVA